MAVITINDLPQSDELDREAMQSIAGGARTGARRVQIVQAMAGSGRIVDYPPGFGRRGPSPTRVCTALLRSPLLVARTPLGRGRADP